MTTEPNTLPVGRQPLSDKGFMIGVTQSDLVLPTYRLVQGSSEIAKSGDAAPGAFYSPELGISKPRIEAVVYMIRHTQTLWGAEPGNAPRCSSDDGYMPRPGSEFEGRQCNKCELRLDEPYKVTADVRRQMCQPGYSLMCMDLDSDMPFLFRASGTSVARVKTWITAIHITHDGEPFRIKTIFQSEQKQGPLGSYFVAYPKAEGVLPENDINNQHRPMAIHLKQQNEATYAVGEGKTEPAPELPNPFNPVTQPMQTADEDDSLF